MIANARMYAVAPGAATAWDAVFRHVAQVAGVPLDIVAHPFPLPVSDLWRRTDLACAFMCGWPWARHGFAMQAVAAPVPRETWPHGAAPGDSGRPVYWSDLVVRADSPAASLQDLAGQRIGFTLLDSQSGFSALRHWLLAQGPAAPLFRSVVGPLTTPRRSIEAVVEGRADAAPIDSFAHAILRRHVPELTRGVRVLARTPPTPIPLLVASQAIDPAVVARLRAAFLGITDEALLEPLTITGFTDPLPQAEYQAMEDRALAAEAAGVHHLGAFAHAEAA